MIDNEESSVSTTENEQVSLDVEPWQQMLIERVSQGELVWATLADFAVSQIDETDKRTPEVREYDRPHLLADVHLGRTIRYAREKATQYRAEHGGEVELTVNRANPLAVGGLRSLDLDDGYRVEVDHDGDELTFMDVSGGGRPDYKLTDGQLYFHRPYPDDDEYGDDGDDDLD